MTKFFIRLMQKRDLEILVQTWEIWASNDKYSSKRTPSSLNDFSTPSLWILSIGKIRDGSTGLPGSLLLKVRTQSAGLINFPLVLKTMNLVFEVFKAILFALNQTAIFCNSSLT